MIDKLPSRDVIRKAVDSRFDNMDIESIRALQELGEYFLTTQLCEPMSEDEIGIRIYKTLTGFNDERAKDDWTAKYYQSSNKQVAFRIVQELVGKIEKRI